MDLLLTIFLFFGAIFTSPVAVDIIDIDDYDPGMCDKSNALQVVSITDRNDEKKLWVCSEKINGNYLWKPVDGEAYLGEFLNPAYDCSDVLNHEPDAQDGFYWVTYGVSTKRKTCFQIYVHKQCRGAYLHWAHEIWQPSLKQQRGFKIDSHRPTQPIRYS